jgi:predicted PurR-regulated permease PerM
VPEASGIPTESLKHRSARSNILFALALLLATALAWRLLHELEILYVSALFAVVLAPIVQNIANLRIRRWSPSRAISILVLLAGVSLFITLFVLIGFPPVFNDLQGFAHELPKRIPAAVERLKTIPLATQLGINQMDLSQIAAKAENFAGAAGAYAFDAIPTWLSHLVDILSTAFLCIYFLLEGDHAYAFFLSLCPLSKRDRLDHTLKRAALKMSKWLFGQGLLMLIMGVTFTIVFYLLHVRYFLLLGILMGIFNIIPIAGAVITVSLAAIVAGFDSLPKMAGVFIAYFIYLNIENAILTPRIMKSSVDLMGLTVLVSLLIGTALAGIVGTLVAVPTAALIAVLLDEYAVHKASQPA